ncbi:MAG: peptidoglycan binding domain-containing protein [Anaerolineae bacterium]|jgi:lipoprotein-anchoring transpeptidase ErfK/SrfK
MADQATPTQPVWSRLTETQPVVRPAQKPSRGLRRLSIGLVVVLALGLLAVAVFAAWILVEITLGPYEGRVYPNVVVLGTELGGLTPQEAAQALAATAQPSDVPTLILRDGERAWSIAGAELGLRLDAEATAQAAFEVGRADQSWSTLTGLLRGRHELPPVFRVDPAVARDALERLAATVSEAPVDATLEVDGGQLVAVPGQPGRALDVEMTLAALQIADITPAGRNEIDLSFHLVAPDVADASPALSQAEALLSRQVQLSTYDVLTGETFSWTLGRDVIINWLAVEQAGGGTGLTVNVAAQAVRATLERLAAELGESRGFRLDEASQRVAETLEAGGGTVALYMTHAPRTAVVEAGDTVTGIARRYGVPPGLVIEANPGVDPNQLTIGQQLTIPSQDFLTPYIPVPGKRIVISLAEQLMRVYQDDQVIWDWPVSTGIESSPTYPGTYQVLSREEMAYASQWDLWMPHFIAIYRAGADVYNGIHALPILSSGRRLWEGSLGSPASYGCIILGIEEAETLYNWVEIGVVIVIE